MPDATSPRIALIHATALAISPIEAAFARLWPSAARMNLLDDSLSRDLAAAGQLTDAMVQRFIDLAKYAKGCGCDAILFTCSAFGPAIEAAGKAVKLPTLKPNQAMFEQALVVHAAHVGRVALVATFAPSLPAMSAEITALPLETVHVKEAMQDLAEDRTQMHHDKIANAIHDMSLSENDIVMLAQFSMAEAASTVQTKTKAKILTSPDCAVQAMKHALGVR